MKSFKTWILIDSGIGGLVYAKALSREYQSVNFAYIGDNENFPYGGKSLPALLTILNDLLDKAEASFDVAGVLFVCNTATVNCLSHIAGTRSYPMAGVHPFVGYSSREEPKRKTLLLSTQATRDSSLVQFYLNEFPEKMKGIALPALVQFAETGNEKWSYVAQEEIEAFKGKLGNWEIEDVYLGCTHFIALASWIAPFFPQAQLVDSCQWLVELFKSFPEDLKKGQGKASFYLTREAQNPDYYIQKAQEAGFKYKGQLP